MLLTIVLAAGMPVASATSEMMDEFNQNYNTSDTRLANCTVCHGSDVQSLNPYGLAYQENNGDFEAIEPLDSDEDSFNNQEEIQSLTFPGDPEDFPESTSDVPQETEQTAEEGQEQPVSNESSTETEQQSPGFEALLAIGILMAIYLLKKK
ncbi:hypothetical protein V7O62_02890 [Methanolobus sp. ZRKC2]|uniref:hypothetical protein n=1 Tax=Methanolobus sp. ZRKC2 TaxID=3125783 RepID=UPI0032501327